MAILKNNPMPLVKKKESKDVFDILELTYNISVERDSGGITTFDLFKKMDEIVSSNLHFPLVKKVSEYQFDTVDTLLFLFIIWKTISGYESTDIGRTTEGIFDDTSERITYIQKILAEENILIKTGLIEIVAANSFNDLGMKLTDYALHMINDCGIKLFANKLKKDNIIELDKIQTKKLLFNKEEGKQLELLKSLLQESSFMKTQERLKERKLPIGITALLHGVRELEKQKRYTSWLKRPEEQL